MRYYTIINKNREIDYVTLDYIELNRSEIKEVMQEISRRDYEFFKSNTTSGITLEYDVKLKSCPFCSRVAVLQHINYSDGDTYYNAQCENQCCMSITNYATKKEAIINWNVRV